MRKLVPTLAVAACAAIAVPAGAFGPAPQVDRSPDFNDPRVVDAMNFCKGEADNLLVGMRTLPDRDRSFTEEKYWQLVDQDVHHFVNLENPLSPSQRSQLTSYRDSTINSMGSFQGHIDETVRNGGNPYSWQVGWLHAKLSVCTNNFELQELYMAGAAKAKASFARTAAPKARRARGK